MYLYPTAKIQILFKSRLQGVIDLRKQIVPRLVYPKSFIYKRGNIEIFINQELCNYFPRNEPECPPNVPSFVTCLEWWQ